MKHKTRLFAVALCAATATVVVAYPQLASRRTPPPPVTTPAVSNKPIAPIVAVAAPAERPKIEVVFALDTTGSMSGLIQAAKENIWSIASSMASAQPAPEIRIGLVAYRDRGDAYVTRVTDLSPDLDSVYATLMDFDADGGGDTEESVNQALADAVNHVSWSSDPKSYKVIFLVGDAPAHMDYKNDVPFAESVKTARAKGIVVNTILAGGADDTRAQWQQIASLSQGATFQVASSGDAVAVATPFDDRLAALSQELDETRLFYGDADQRREFETKDRAIGKLRAGSSVGSQAKRAAFNASSAGASNLFGKNELVDDVSNGRVDLATLDTKTLPAPMQAMKKDEMLKVVQDAAGKRKAIAGEISDVSRQRQAFIESKLEKDEATASLDAKVYNAVKEQAAKKGLRYEAGPKY